MSLKARNVSTIDAIVLGVAASGTAAIEVPIVVNDISNTTEATITDSTLTTDANLTLDAESCNVIRAISVGISGSGALAVTVAGLGNVITNTLTSLITGSTITAAGDVSLSANDLAPSDIPEMDTPARPETAGRRRGRRLSLRPRQQHPRDHGERVRLRGCGRQRRRLGQRDRE